MYIKASWVMLVLLLLGGRGSSSRSSLNTPGFDREAQMQRRKQLIEVIELHEGWSRASYRAGEELSLYGNIREVEWKTLIELITKGKTASQRCTRYLDALASAGAPAVSDILNALPTAGSARSYLIVSLGRMGPAAKSAIPTLRQMLGDPKIDASTKATVRIALANLGDHSKENLAAILADLRNQDSRGGALWALLYIRPTEWVNEAIITELTTSFKTWVESKPSAVLWQTDIGGGATALGVLGERAASAADLLETAQKTAVEVQSWTALPYTLVLARVDPKRQEAALRRALRGDNPFQIWDLKGGHFWMLEYFHLLVDGRISECLVGLLGDPDPKVAMNAAFCLEMAGLASRVAAPQALKFLQGKAEEDRRAWAAYALRSIAEYRLLPKLEVALKREKSEKVRKELEGAITYIRNLPRGWR